MSEKNSSLLSILVGVGGLAAGLAFGAVLWMGGPEEGDSLASQTPVDTAPLKKEIADLKDSKKALEDQLVIAREEKTRLEGNLKAEKEKLKKAEKKGTAEQQRADALQARLDEAGIEEVEVNELTPEEIAAIKTKAISLNATISTAIAAKDKASIIKAFNDMKALGKPAMLEILNAYAEIYRNGNPWEGPSALGFAAPEFISLFPWQYNAEVLDMSRNDIPMEARYSALGGIAYGSPDPQTTVERVSEVLSHTSDERLVGVGIYVLTNDVKNTEASKALTRIATNGKYSPKTRVSAIKGIDPTQIDDETWAAIEGLASDASPEVQAAVKSLADQRSSPATGIYITSVGVGSAGERAGLKVGDILMTYDGVETKTIMGLIQARDREGAALTVWVEVYRDGEVLRLQLSLGDDKQIGINGRPVTKS